MTVKSSATAAIRLKLLLLTVSATFENAEPEDFMVHL
jgi:hypothetical protein